MTAASSKKKPSGFKFSANSKKNMAGVNPILVTLAEQTLQRSPFDFGVISNGGFRTAEMQHELFLKGRSKLDGYIQISHHQLGNAIDLVPYIDGKFTWSNKKAFEGIHKVAMQVWAEMNVKGVQLTWGGHWSFYDPAHYQIKTKR